ncbi:tripartite ATP-independent transporter DctM subunit [Devosia subaequoris]|uniref:TRAP transporter large permease protein n=1 Tax=Devosia subaequoris TaxID=395930 RepID=A0A7W6IPN7_9HYPH|nr:TRAP transporter large permease [Devosia subaequoris]MBB4053555.1 tripartite ATP-independent transporter DctM subunit [Devosia subaequoris]MCP1211292.1 TRAP transporter large permease [Devosia subaequoris]
MEWYIFLSGAFFLLLALFAVGLPVFIAFLALNLAGLFLISGNFNGVTLIINSMFSTSTSLSLAAIPLFVLLGELLFRSGSVRILFDAVDGVVGNIRARLYVVSILLSTLFGALSGSAMAVAAMMGSSLWPEMKARNYDLKLSMGTMLAGSSLAPIIPPSVMAIVLGMLANVSISALLIAGIVPGLILSILFLGYVVIRTRINPSLAPISDDTSLPLKQRLMLVVKALPFLLIIGVILGFILAGIATPTESAAVGCVAAVVVCAMFGNLNWPTIRDSLRSTASISGMIMIIMACSVSFSQVLNMSGATSQLVQTVTELALPLVLMFILLQFVPFVLCMFIDQIALMIMLVPLYTPIISAIGFDPLWFWMIFLINMSIGGITPPFGYTLFALKGVIPEASIQSVYRAALPFIGICMLAIALFATFPDIILAVPALL